MEEGTLRLSNLKADVGAELWLMKSSLDEVGWQQVFVVKSKKPAYGVKPRKIKIPPLPSDSERSG